MMEGCKCVPVKVSPLIKGARWTLLLLGIVYGAMKHSFLSEREVGIREEETQKRKAKEAQIKAEKEAASKKDIEILSELFLGKQ